MSHSDNSGDVEVNISEDGHLLGDEDFEKSLHRPSKHPRSLEWILCIVLILSIILALDDIRLRRKRSFANGFITDLDVSTQASQLIEYRFTGGIEVNDQGKLYREVNLSQPQYVGEPTPEIDQAWEDLVRPVDLLLDKKDAPELKTTSVQTAYGEKLLVSLDVYHSLHCLDLVRKAVDFQYYYPIGEVPYFYRYHVDHCIDYLRQGLQCQSDLTPLTYEEYAPKNTGIPVFKTPHTCRNFSKVHEWALERSLDNFFDDVKIHHRL